MKGLALVIIFLLVVIVVLFVRDIYNKRKISDRDVTIEEQDRRIKELERQIDVSENPLLALTDEDRRLYALEKISTQRIWGNGMYRIPSNPTLPATELDNA